MDLKFGHLGVYSHNAQYIFFFHERIDKINVRMKNQNKPRKAVNLNNDFFH